MSEITAQEQRTINQAIAGLVTSIAASIPPLHLVVAAKDAGVAAWDLYWTNEKEKEKRAEHVFDLILAVVCIIPCVGGAFRFSFKTILRSPETYGTVLFLIIEGIISEIKGYYASNPKYQMPDIVKTLITHNPEALIDKIFDKTKIQACIQDVRKQVVQKANENWLGKWIADDLDAFLGQIIPFSITVLEVAIINKILRMKKMARGRNSGTKGRDAAATNTGTSKGGSSTSSNGSTTGTAKTNTGGRNKPPRNKGTSGTGAARTTTRRELRDKLKSLTSNAKARLSGGIGEHVMDYYFYEVMKWGHSWDDHDKGNAGKWRTIPDNINPGRLDKKYLSKLRWVDPGTGLDGFWRATQNNMGKKYAVVESKSSLTPFTEHSKMTALGALAASSGVDRINGIAYPIIQMSHKWIGDRLPPSGVSGAVRTEIRANSVSEERLKKLYARHIIYTNLSSSSSLQHVKTAYDAEKEEMRDFNQVNESLHRGHGQVQAHVMDSPVLGVSHYVQKRREHEKKKRDSKGGGKGK